MATSVEDVLRIAEEELHLFRGECMLVSKAKQAYRDVLADSANVDVCEALHAELVRIRDGGALSASPSSPRHHPLLSTRPSPVHGTGLFAARRAIAKGELVGVIVGELRTVQSQRRLPRLERAHAFRYSFKLPRPWGALSWELSKDAFLFKFGNTAAGTQYAHNAEIRWLGNLVGAVYCTVDIPKGHELLYEYDLGGAAATSDAPSSPPRPAKRRRQASDEVGEREKQGDMDPSSPPRWQLVMEPVKVAVARSTSPPAVLLTGLMFVFQDQKAHAVRVGVLMDEEENGPEAGGGGAGDGNVTLLTLPAVAELAGYKACRTSWRKCIRIVAAAGPGGEDTASLEDFLQRHGIPLQRGASASNLRVNGVFSMDATCILQLQKVLAVAASPSGH